MSDNSWFCRRCKQPVMFAGSTGDLVAGKCGCEQTPSPWVRLEYPRWGSPENLTSLERRVYDAFQVVENAGAHPLLTSASQAIFGAVQNLVAWADGGSLGASSPENPLGADVRRTQPNPDLAQGLRDTARWIRARDPLATNYLFCLQAADYIDAHSSESGHLTASVGRNPEGEDPVEGLRAEHEHAVPPEEAGDAQTPPSESPS